MATRLLAAQVRLYFPVLLIAGIFFFLPIGADAQGLVRCGIGSNPLGCQFCDLFALVNTIIKYLITTSIGIAAVLFAYAGFLFFTSGGSEERISKARSIFSNVFIGLLITLVAFTVVNTLLQTMASGYLSPPSWNIVACINNRYLGGTFGASASQSGVVGGSSTLNPVVLTGDCATGNLPQPSGSSWTSAQTQVMGCIAQAESSCNPTIQYSGPENSNATGLYQIIIGGYNDQGHNLNFPSCAAAVGASGNLNCYQSWVDGGKQLHSPQLATCETAAKDPQCNTDAANYLMQQACAAGNCYSPWAQTATRCAR